MTKINYKIKGLRQQRQILRRWNLQDQCHQWCCQCQFQLEHSFRKYSKRWQYTYTNRECHRKLCFVGNYTFGCMHIEWFFVRRRNTIANIKFGNPGISVSGQHGYIGCQRWLGRNTLKWKSDNTNNQRWFSPKLHTHSNTKQLQQQHDLWGNGGQSSRNWAWTRSGNLFW